MRNEDKHFTRHAFTKEQTGKFIENARKDLAIADRVTIPEVRFSFSYSALIKGGIALLSYQGLKVKSLAGHHVMILEKTAELLKEPSIQVIGNIMRTKRNLDFYGGGTEITEKEAAEFLDFVRAILKRIERLAAGRAPKQ